MKIDLLDEGYDASVTGVPENTTYLEVYSFLI